MIPLKDLNPRLTPPVMTFLIIVVNVGVFLYQVSLGQHAGQALAYVYGIIPARIPEALTTSSVTLPQAFLPLVTSMFLHGGWFHLIGNMWFLWIFGDNIEDQFGHFGYLLFYLFSGIGAGLTHAVMNLGSGAPAIGASGAVSGVMGAYMVFFPRSRVLTLVPFFVFFTVQLPAVVVLGYWFLIQFLSGVGSLGLHTDTGVAFWAHIGGFLLGVLVALGTKLR